MISLIFHASLALILLFIYLPTRDSRDSPSPAGSTGEMETGGKKDSQRPGDVIAPPTAVTNIPREQIEKSIAAQIEQTEQLSDTRKLTELEKNLQRLQSMSSEESVEDMTATIAETLGLDPSQYDPSKPPGEGSFDHDSAQLHDVTRRKSERGDWQYESILVDSAGRKLNVPMDAVEGETVYSTFQEMKEYPLAASIYRGVVMPMIQKMTQAQQVARELQSSLPPIESSIQESSDELPPDDGQRAPRTPR